MSDQTFLYIKNEPKQPEKVPDAPWMDAEGLKLFKNIATSSQCYLEFGSGGSTMYMLKNTDAKIISVDSDGEWVKNIINSIDDNQKNRLHIEHCNIGAVGAWGTPRNNSAIHNYWHYMSAPWDWATENNLIPDLILVDGRFRVASFLYSLLSSQIGSTILFDDYLDRPEYFVVENFCKPIETAGRMAIFKVTKDYSIPEICKVISKYSVNPD